MSCSEPRPLDGIKVLDLTRVVSGPFATMQLGDLGADIVKIEEPGDGDEARRFGPPFQGGESAYFLSVNRNKRSCAIDLKSPAGKDLVRRLAATADVVVENFRPGTLERLGLGFEVLSSANPRLILCSITGFGRTGPDAARPGYDLIVQGEAGLMDVTGEEDGPPSKVGSSIADLATGLYAAQAVLAALLRRGRTGRGERVDVAMLDATASLLTVNAGIYFATGKSPRRRGNAHPTITPYESFAAADGWINLGVANDKFWAQFCAALARPDLFQDPRFRLAPDRVTHRAALRAILEPIFRTRPRRAWIDLLTGTGVPCGEITSVGAACEAAQLTERDVVRRIAHPTAGEVRLVVSPLRFADRAQGDIAPPPRLGEHTAPVLAEWLGLGLEEVDRAAAAGAFGAATHQRAAGGDT